MEKHYQILGMMSGTSLDGLDMAHCELWIANRKWNFIINEAITVPYSPELRQQLKNAILLSEQEHAQLHLEYGKWLGEQAKKFINENKIKVDFIASHGHTSHHRPEDGITFQLGSGQELANISNQKVVCDFRTLDVKLGGQGAPLVPIGDELLFEKYDFCLNLGGISNISFKSGKERIAYDIGMANMPLNHITQQIGKAYDDNGEMAAKGKIIPELFEALNRLKYYELPYPKSTGFEWFSEKVLPLLEKSNYLTEDLLHTVIQHNCHQIAKAVSVHLTGKKSTMLVCGGGALNSFFVETLNSKLQPDCEVLIPEKKLINFKEALVFALMGVLKFEGKTNILCSVTGASENSSSGMVFLPN